jgi:pyruvate kinase
MLEKILPHLVIARMNMSHGTHAEHETKIKRVRALSNDTEIMVDLQ